VIDTSLQQTRYQRPGARQIGPSLVGVIHALVSAWNSGAATDSEAALKFLRRVQDKAKIGEKAQFTRE
jgi:hypothetical protein